MGAQPRPGPAAPSFLARRWRFLLFVVVAMLATSVVAVLADRGHDPVWRRELGNEIDAISFTDSGDRILILETRPYNGTPVALTALDAEGAFVWNLSLNASYPKFAAGDGFVAVATAPTPANLSVYDARDGTLLWTHPLPRAFASSLAAQGDLLVMALQTAPPTVQVFERNGTSFALRVNLTFPGDGLNSVKALSVLRGTVAAGDALGNVIVWRNGSRLLETQAPLRIQSLALGDGGNRLLIGGQQLDEGSFVGVVRSLDLRAPTPTAATLWEAFVEGPVSYAAMAPEGSAALALADSPPAPVLRGYPDAAGDAGWSAHADKIVRSVLPNRGAAVSLDPAGRSVAYVSQAGSVTVLDAVTGAPLWSYRTFGGNALEYTPKGGAFVAGVRVLSDRPATVLMGFDVDEEPFVRDLSRQVPALLGVEALLALGYLGFRGIRERR